MIGSSRLSAEQPRHLGTGAYKISLVLSIVLALQGLGWVVLGSFDPWGVYDGLWARSLYSTDALPPAAARARDFLLILLGATDVAYFVLFGLVLRGGWHTGQAWATRALIVSFFTWFSLDSAFCLLGGATFNVLVVNLPALVMVLPPLALVHRSLVSRSAEPD